MNDKEDMVHIDNEILLSHRKNAMRPLVAIWMDLEIILLSEVNQTEKEKFHVISLYVDSKNMTQMSLFAKQEQTYRYKKQIYGYQSGKLGGEIN